MNIERPMCRCDAQCFSSFLFRFQLCFTFSSLLLFSLSFQNQTEFFCFAVSFTAEFFRFSSIATRFQCGLENLFFQISFSTRVIFAKFYLKNRWMKKLSFQDNKIFINVSGDLNIINYVK